MNGKTMGMALFLAGALCMGAGMGKADAAGAAGGGAPIEIGDRLEPFVDLFLVDQMKGVTHRFQKPIEIRNLANPPSAGYYSTVIFDRNRYLHYCRETIPGYTGSGDDGNPGEVTVYEESTDGINWTRPNLGLFEVNGSRSNNYVLANMGPFSHNFSPFLDKRPGCPPEERFKALAGISVSGGLVAFVSPDGIRWTKLREEPVLKVAPGDLMFDSQNVSVWSPVENQYVAYCRQHIKGLRSIVRATSPDFLTWSAFEPVPANLENEHLYTSQAHPYFRAPHITIGLATRFFPNQGSSTDIALLSSRDGKSFGRVLKEAFIRPAPTRESWGNRGNYAALNVYPLRNDRPDVPDEWRHSAALELMGIMVRDRIYYLPLDGFASISAGFEDGEMITKPLRFTGKELLVNFETSAGGFLRVEIQDADGKAVPGFSAGDMKEDLRYNARGQIVVWNRGSDISSLAGQTIRLRFVMREADLYALRFVTR
jgi:hypothetical protein